VLVGLRELALRHRFLSAQIDRMDTDLEVLAAEAAPRFLAVYGVGPEVAGALIVVAESPTGARCVTSNAWRWMQSALPER
jgi:hypothetical protein